MRAQPPRDFERVLVANRGEIARRVLRTLREMGIGSVAVYSDADADAPHVREADQAVRIGEAPAASSYLRGDRIVEAARATGAAAVHPGYGFLAENAEFAAQCAAAGLVFIGPSAEVIRRLGSKLEAKALMQAAGVPVVPGFPVEGLSEREIARRARELGYPLLVKASAGGGGKGMRAVAGEDELGEALAAARREALAAFGDGALLVEKRIEASRHVEVQIVGDAHGALVHCFERDCSLQRRHQKLIEESPAPALAAALRGRLGEAAVAAGKAIGYQGAGTVEFLLGPGGAFYFLEINTRLQVEHPVTELVTGLDLVRLQIEIARGLPLPFGQAELVLAGHAVEARLYAEDPARDFLPTAGRIALWEPPQGDGIRVDAGVEAGSRVGVHYDALLAKLVAHGATRDEARRRLAAALRRLGVAGVTTNRDFLVLLLEHPAFAAAQLDTGFVERELPASARSPAPDLARLALHARAAALYEHEARRASPGPLPASIPSGWRNSRFRPQQTLYETAAGRLEVSYVARAEGRFDVSVSVPGAEPGETPAGPARVAAWQPGELRVELDGVLSRLAFAEEGERIFVHGPTGGSELRRVPRFEGAGSRASAAGCIAPMTGVIREVRVCAGDRVERGQVLLVLEAMKMEHVMAAEQAGVVKEVRVRVGQMVDPDQVLVVVEAG